MAFKGSFIIAVSVLFALAACQDTGKKPSSTIYYNISVEPATISPLASSDVGASSVHAYVFEGLLDKDVDTYEWKPALATEWTISKDKKVFEYKLREGVKW